MTSTMAIWNRLKSASPQLGGVLIATVLLGLQLGCFAPALAQPIDIRPSQIVQPTIRVNQTRWRSYLRQVKISGERHRPWQTSLSVRSVFTPLEIEQGIAKGYSAVFAFHALDESLWTPKTTFGQPTLPERRYRALIEIRSYFSKNDRPFHGTFVGTYGGWRRRDNQFLFDRSSFANLLIGQRHSAIGGISFGTQAVNLSGLTIGYKLNLGLDFPLIAMSSEGARIDANIPMKLDFKIGVSMGYTWFKPARPRALQQKAKPVAR